MARIRTIKPEFWNDEDIGELSMAARLAFIASWSLCDDEGLLPWTPAYIRAQVFAYDDMNFENVEEVLRELQEKSLVVPYKDGKGKRYGWIVNFRKHQRIDKPQKPKHPLPSIQNPEIRKVYAERDGWCCSICGGEIDRHTENKFEVLSLDHTTPRASGGSDAPSNIRAAHFGCNSSKKDKEDSKNSPGTVQEHSDTEGIKDQGKEQGKEGSNVASKDATSDYSPEFEQAWKDKPRREGGNSKKAAYKAWKARIREGATVNDLVDGMQRYRKFCEAKRIIGTDKVKMMATFWGPDEHYLEDYAVQKIDSPPEEAPRPSYRKEMPRPDRPDRRV